MPKLMLMTVQSNGLGGLLPSPVVMARAPKCLLAAALGLQTGKSTIRDAIRISNGLQLPPAVAFQDIQNADRKTTKRKQVSSANFLSLHLSDQFCCSPPASLPSNLEQHLCREQQHHHLPGDNYHQIIIFSSYSIALCEST